jgi:uncharacterized protein (TIGR02001 family)
MEAIKKYLPVSAVAGILTLGAVAASPAMADVEASAGVANTYLFRGVDQSNGKAQVFGDLTYRTDLGIYTSIWGSTAEASQEYNLIAGWAKDFSGLVLNIGAINYVYPKNDLADDFGAESEGFVGIGWNGLEAYLYKNVASAHRDKNGFLYFATSYSYKKFSGTLGYAQNDRISSRSGYKDGEYSYLHLDLTYAFNDNLSFTFSQMLDRDAKADGQKYKDSTFADLAESDPRYADIAEGDMLFVVTYSLPLEI